MKTVYLSTAYLGPVQQYCKLCEYDEVCMETAENYLKQTYRNRCVIASAGGSLRGLAGQSDPATPAIP